MTTTLTETVAAPSLAEEMEAERNTGLERLRELLFRIVEQGEDATSVPEVRAVCAAAGKTQGEFLALLDTVRARVAAAAQLREAARVEADDLPRLRATVEAADAEYAALVQRNREAEQRAAQASHAKRAEQRAAQERIQRLRADATGTLSQTADPAIDAEIARLSDERIDVWVWMQANKLSSSPRALRPEIDRLREEIARLESQRGDGQEVADLREKLQLKEADLAAYERNEAMHRDLVARTESARNSKLDPHRLAIE